MIPNIHIKQLQIYRSFPFNNLLNIFGQAAMTTTNISNMRKPYLDRASTFDVQDLSALEPFGQFRAWFDAARTCEAVEEPNAVCLATASREGIPSARMVLLKEFGEEEDGFVFYTNYGSRKGREIEENPNAALMFFWAPLKRSVRIEGTVVKMSKEKAIEYFHSRPFDSQIGAAISDQSQVIANRNVLMEKEFLLRKEYESSEKVVPKPENWGGYRVVPHTFEFWQGQSTRIHDRLRFRKLKNSEEQIDEKYFTKGEKGWIIERLAP